MSFLHDNLILHVKIKAILEAIESFFFAFGILGLIHFISIARRFIKGYIGKQPDIAKKYNTKWILIAGASNGVGMHLAIKLAKQGYNIIGTGRNKKRLQDVSDKCTKNGTEFRQIIVDFESPDASDIVMNAISDIDVGVYFLAVGLPIYRYFFDYSESELVHFQDIMVVNQAILYNAIIQKNKNRKEESLIYIIASLAGEVPIANGQMYCSVKSFVSSCARHLALELSHYTNIKIQAIHPGVFASSGFFDSAPKFLERFVNIIKFSLISSEDVANFMLKSMGNSIQCDITAFSIISIFSYWLTGTWLFNRFLYCFIPRLKLD